jgi:hypothetical protein
MGSHNQFDLRCNRPDRDIEVRFADIEETDEAFKENSVAIRRTKIMHFSMRKVKSLEKSLLNGSGH